MREYNFMIRDALSNGLRPVGMGRNSPYCDRMKNLVPWGTMARTPKWPTFPISGSFSGEWPWPQLTRGESVTLLRDKTELYSVNESTWSTTAMTRRRSYSPSVSDVALTGTYKLNLLEEFGECWFLCDGNGLWFKLPYFSDYVLRYSVTYPTIPELSAIAKFDNRLFIGGLDGGNPAYEGWFYNARVLIIEEAWRKTAPEHVFISDDSDPFSTRNWIVWSEPNGGADDMPFYLFLAMLGAFSTDGFDKVHILLKNSIENRRIGMLQLPTQGQVRRLIPFGPGMLAFCDDGICDVRRTREDSYYEATKSDQLTLANPAAIDGDSGQIVFVDKAGILWRYWMEDQYRRTEQRDYSEFFNAMDLAKLRVTRDAHRNHYWLSDGTTCYVWTPQGLGGPMDLRPTSVQIKDGAPLGYTFGTSSGQVQVASAPLDINERGRKHITTYQIAYSGLTAVKGAVDYRYNSVSEYVRSTLKPANPEGVVYPGVSFVDGRVVVQGDVSGTSAEIERIEVRYQNEDRRARRGTKGQPEES